jgi:signal peptidase I
MAKFEKIQSIGKRHKGLIIAWVVILILFVGMLLNVLPIGITHGESMWPTFSHVTIIVIDRWYPVNKIKMGDIIAFRNCMYYPSCESGIEGVNEQRPLTELIFGGNEIAHRVTKIKVYPSVAAGDREITIFSTKGDCANCKELDILDEIYLGKVVWYFNLPV